MGGHVDRVNNFGVSGWATTAGDGGSDIVEIVVDGHVHATVLASIFSPHLKEKGKADGNCVFRYEFTPPIGLLKDSWVEIRSKSTGQILAPGARLVKSLLTEADGYRFNLKAPVYTASLRSIKKHDRVIELDIAVFAPQNANLAPVIKHPSVATIDEFRVSEGGGRPGRINDVKNSAIRCYSMHARMTYDIDSKYVFATIAIENRAAPEGGSSHCEIRVPLRSTWSAIPTEDNWKRVAGPGVTQDTFIMGGLNTAAKISSIARRYVDLDGDVTVVDWGVGCGRVAVPLRRIFLPRGQLIGFDVDKFNVDWCQDNLHDIKTSTCDFYPPLQLESESVDVLYGISVMTHLTEAAQEVWLRELKRVLKPTGVCILSAHAEFAVVFTDLSNIAYQQIKSFGFSDVSYNWNGLAPDLPIKSYYRGTFQLRDQIYEAWSRNFRIVEYLPGENELNQDFIVLRKAS